MNLPLLNDSSRKASETSQRLFLRSLDLHAWSFSATPFLLLKAFDTRSPGLPRAATRPFLCLRRIAAMRGLGGLFLARAKRTSAAAPQPPQRPQAYARSSARLPHEGSKLRNQARRARRRFAHRPARARRLCLP